MEAPRSEMAVEILAYLLRHPSAHDTVEGILQWWLLERYIERQRTAVEAAVDELVESGWLLVRQGRDRRRRYGLDPNHAAEAREVVSHRRAAPGGEA